MQSPHLIAAESKKVSVFFKDMLQTGGDFPETMPWGGRRAVAPPIIVLPSCREITQICAQLPMEHKVMRSPKFGQAAVRNRRGVFEMAVAAGLTLAGFSCMLGGSPATRPMRLAREPWLTAPFVLIPERPG